MKGPAKIAQMDISQIKPIINDDNRYGSASVLLRSGDEVIQMVRVPFHGSTISEEDLLRVAKNRISYHLVLEDLKNYTGIPIHREQPKQPITVIVCTRNRTALLRDCLDALRELDYFDFEILIIDNAPDNDQTKQLAAEFGVRYFREDKPGLDRARNRGIREASYPIVAFTDDDARPDKYWLKNIALNFLDEQVMAVTGYVAAAALETEAQQLFEWGYGGMGHGFSKKRISGSLLSNRSKLAASSFGVGANMAFRKSCFDRIGLFDPALDVGTPSSGGGDIEMFHRIVARHGVLVYDPNVLVWHLHRPGMEALKKQVFNNGRSFVCYLMTCYRNKTVGAGALWKFFFRDWVYQWLFKNIIFGRGKVSRRLLLMELKGMVSGPSAYFQSQRFSSMQDSR